MQIKLDEYSAKPWLKKYDPHVPSSLNYPVLSLVDLLSVSSKRYPGRNCFIYQDSIFTYQEVETISGKIARGLIQLGIKPGDHVGIILPNTPLFGFIYFGILKAGAVVVAINPNYRPREITEMASTCQMNMVFSLEEKLNDLQQVCIEYPIRTIISCSISDLSELKTSQNHSSEKVKADNSRIKLLDLMNLGMSSIRLPSISPQQPAVLQFTGGTTGTPKAAIGLHRNLAANTNQFITWCDLQSGQEVVLAVIPLYHVYGMVLALCLGISLGAEILFWDRPRELDRLLHAIEMYHVTFFPAVPSLYYAINAEIKSSGLKPDLKSLKACISGSDALHPDVKKEFEILTGAKLMEGYGLSEAPTATHCNPLHGENRAGSIGLPLPDVECKVIGIENEFQIVPIGENGELVIKGPQVMQAYFQNDVETAQILRDGWLHTGDVVRMDADGYFYMVDRKKSLIKVSGFQVWPNEIEQVLVSHPAIKEAGVAGVPDEPHGEKVIAWVVLNTGFNPDVNEIRNWCRQNLAAYKVPSEIHFMESLPRTSVGKVLRRELVRRYTLKNK